MRGSGGRLLERALRDAHELGRHHDVGLRRADDAQLVDDHAAVRSASRAGRRRRRTACAGTARAGRCRPGPWPHVQVAAREPRDVGVPLEQVPRHDRRVAARRRRRARATACAAASRARALAEHRDRRILDDAPQPATRSRATGTVLISTSPRQSGSSSPRSTTPSSARRAHAPRALVATAPRRAARRPRDRRRRAARRAISGSSAGGAGGARRRHRRAATRRSAGYSPRGGACTTRWPPSTTGRGCTRGGDVGAAALERGAALPQPRAQLGRRGRASPSAQRARERRASSPRVIALSRPHRSPPQRATTTRRASRDVERRAAADAARGASRRSDRRGAGEHDGVVGGCTVTRSRVHVAQHAYAVALVRGSARAIACCSRSRSPRARRRSTGRSSASARSIATTATRLAAQLAALPGAVRARRHAAPAGARSARARRSLARRRRGAVIVVDDRADRAAIARTPRAVSRAHGARDRRRRRSSSRSARMRARARDASARSRSRRASQAARCVAALASRSR